jgi:hypothetical protein
MHALCVIEIALDMANEKHNIALLDLDGPTLTSTVLSPSLPNGLNKSFYTIKVVTIHKSKCRSKWAQHAAPNKKGNVGRRKTGGAGRQSVVPAARLGTVVDCLVASQEARPSSQ